MWEPGTRVGCLLRRVIRKRLDGVSQKETWGKGRKDKVYRRWVPEEPMVVGTRCDGRELCVSATCTDVS